MTTSKRLFCVLLTFLMAFSPSGVVWADPCGMVAPIWLGGGAPLARIGAQRTYVFYKDGIETFVIRPGFSGKVEEFGMLIPFPSPPAIRKVADDVFAHIGAAVDPPEVVVDLNQRFNGCCDMVMLAAGSKMRSLGYTAEEKEQVRVIRQEAVGMYEVAVLEAGSAKALQRWMDDHGFRYPDGMDDTCEDYVELGWCFVAVRARVGKKRGSEPQPCMREVDTKLPAGASFDGHVQGMGFRFRTEEFVLPMRLSAFNEGELHNTIYILTDGPQRVANLPETFVARQIPGWQLYRNLTDPLPLRVIGGNLKDIPEWRRNNLPNERNPIPHSGIARDIFASDLLAVRENRLAHPHEEDEKVLLEIGERLGLRGPALDALHAEALKAERERVVEEALKDLQGMTLTVIDGDFPREVIAAENLSFAAYGMPSGKNNPRHFDARFDGPAPALGGFLSSGTLPGSPGSFPGSGLPALALFAFVLAAIAAVALRRTRRLMLRAMPVTSLALLVAFAPPLRAREGDIDLVTAVEELAYPIRDAKTVNVLVACGKGAIPRLVQEALEGSTTISRGWAVVALKEIGTEEARRALARVDGGSSSGLVRTWAAAARVSMSTTAEELASLSDRALGNPALQRPVRQRWTALLSDVENDDILEFALAAFTRNYELQTRLGPAILAVGPERLVRCLTQGRQESRNLAAAYLATLAAQGNTDVARLVIDAYRFEPEAQRIPWQGGPLFLPSLGWTSEDARMIAGHLISWHLWCEVRDKNGEKTQIHNNLRSVGLANPAGYKVPSWQEVGSANWLLAWGQAFGSSSMTQKLTEQGLENDLRYWRITIQLQTR